MTYDTINDAVTMAGGAGALLAGRYRIVKQLGQGGMGSVWLAEDTQLDNKPFAIKMLPPILVSNKRAYRQLKDEALVAMQLVHPNIVQIRAFEENDGNPFLVMDYIDGQTLDDYLAEHTGTTGVPPVDVLRILRPIAAALDSAHAKGVVHRDVKPGNVMIAKDGTPYILDFGIAREIQETMTRVTGKLSSGTLLYMSPEQLMGEPPKPAQDIYSFAVMAYECLKGEPPFSHGQIEFQIMNKRPEPLTGNAAILAAGVMAGLAKKPEDRPATCAAVLEGDGFSHKERKERKEAGGSRPVATEVGGSRPVATDDAQSGRARSPSAPQGDDNVRVEHVERVDGKARDDGNGKVPRKKVVVGLIALLGLSVIGGLWWGLSRDKDKPDAPSKEPEIVKPVQSERGVRRKVQLWEGGPYWACKNIGAEEPWESGYYFWWGDTVGYKRVNDAWVASDGSSLNFSFDTANTLTYGKNSSQLLDGKWITAEGVLAPEHDAAHVQWGDKWRMPTKQELKDLDSKCDWKWAILNGVKGYVVRGRGNYETNSIFLPCTGYGNGTSLRNAGSYGHYWSSYLDYIAWSLDFFSDRRYTFSFDCRYNGHSVRPVQGPAK